MLGTLTLLALLQAPAVAQELAPGVRYDPSIPTFIHEPVGDGQIIAFAEDPNYRAYAEATQRMFMNAVLLGPGR